MLATAKYIKTCLATSGLIRAKFSFHSSSIIKSDRNPLLIKIKTFTNKKGLAFKTWFLKKWGKTLFT